MSPEVVEVWEDTGVGCDPAGTDVALTLTELSDLILVVTVPRVRSQICSSLMTLSCVGGGNQLNCRREHGFETSCLSFESYVVISPSSSPGTNRWTKQFGLTLNMFFFNTI